MFNWSCAGVYFDEKQNSNCGHVCREWRGFDKRMCDRLTEPGEDFIMMNTCCPGPNNCERGTVGPAGFAQLAQAGSSLFQSFIFVAEQYVKHDYTHLWYIISTNVSIIHYRWLKKSFCNISENTLIILYIPLWTQCVITTFDT